MRHALITGSAGFIGYHLCAHLLNAGWRVTGFDGMTDYYDVALKHARHDQLRVYDAFTAIEARLEDRAAVLAAAGVKDGGDVSHAKQDSGAVSNSDSPDVIIHLAAQAGVRYSIENPRSYVDANLIGTFHVMEAALATRPAHLLMASTSSVYGANTTMPYAEIHPADTQMSFYAATKKATEALSHSWAHIHGLPTTMFRFFTVYGPWGRPDMALFKFTQAILNGDPIDIYNHGEMWRDFTYVDDLVRGIAALCDCPPPAPSVDRPAPLAGDSLSAVAPWRVVNIGNADQVKLSDFVDILEEKLGRPAKRNMMPMQPGDVPSTWADVGLLRALTGEAPKTKIHDGVAAFVDWYRDYYGV